MSNEFLINTYGAQWQENPDITRLKDGSIVVVWDSFFSEDDIDVYYIAMQHYTAAGRRIGGETILNAFDGAQSRHPSVTALADGGFAVAWESAIGDSILDQSDLYMAAYDKNGTRRGNPVLVDGANRDDQYAASIVATSDGGTIVTWSSYEGPKTEKQDEIYVRRFDADGDPIGARRLVNQFHTFDQHNSRATMLSNGTVLITWESQYAGGPTPSGVNDDGVRARLYSQTLRPLSDEFLLIARDDGMNSGIGLTDSAVDVAAMKDGRFVASWYETVLHDDRDTTFEIHAQIYDNDGSKIGREIAVRAKSVSVPDHSAVTVLSDGKFVVAWDAFGSQTYAFEEVWARVYDANGRALGAEFRVNPPSGRTVQDNPELQALPGGGFWVVYQSEYLDGDDEAIAGRIYNVGSFGRDVQTMTQAGTYRALAGADDLTGSAGDDILHLGRGDDLAFGGAGDDVLRGGLGADRLDGGAGADRYLYARAEASLADRPDTVVLEGGHDRIVLSHFDAVSTAEGRQSFVWIAGAAFSGQAGELRFAGGVLAADLDGDARADFAIRVTGDAVTPAELIL